MTRNFSRLKSGKAVCLVRRYQRGLFWGTVTTGSYCLVYDTELFPSVEAVKRECKAFCRWKGLKIIRWVKEL